jgi:hypothetical protein
MKEIESLKSEQKRGRRVYSVTNTEDNKTEIKEFPLAEEKEFLAEIEAHNLMCAEKMNAELFETYSKKERKETEAPQGSKQWLEDRTGLITSSDTPFTINGEKIPTFDKYVDKKVAEEFAINVLGEKIEETITTKAMLRGNILEVDSRMAYELETLNVVEERNLIYIDGVKSGSSLDGYVRVENMGIEIKCPQLNTFLTNLYSENMKDNYNIQMQHQMLIADLDSVDFVVYYPKMKLQITNIKRCDLTIGNMIRTIIKFESEFERKYKLLEDELITL